MQSRGKEDPVPVCSKSEMALGRCLIEDDPEVTQPAHGGRLQGIRGVVRNRDIPPDPARYVAAF